VVVADIDGPGAETVAEAQGLDPRHPDVCSAVSGISRSPDVAAVPPGPVSPGVGGANMATTS
jgi:hypothetical protein